MRSARSSVSFTRSAGPRPCSVSTDSDTSSALPAVWPSGSLIGVSTASVFTPHSRPVAQSAAASVSASARFCMNAPLPNFTSSTSRSSDSASFFDMMLATMSGMLGTVAVTSRSA